MVSIDEGIQIDFNANFSHNFGLGQNSRRAVPNRPSKQTRDSGNPPSGFNSQTRSTLSFDALSASMRKPMLRGIAFIL
jgi:hypothetical protein